MENLENEVLQKIKFALLCKNEAIAIRLLEQYRFDVTEEMYSEEDMLLAFIAGVDKESYRGESFDVWFEQFKKYN